MQAFIPEEIKVFINCALLAIKMNGVNESTHVHVPESWRSKNYAFQFFEIISSSLQNDIMDEIVLAVLYT